MENDQLQQLVEEISLTHFNKPFLHKAYFNRRLRTTGGRYMINSSNIEINYHCYEEHGINEIINIIKHELCHYHLHLEGKGYQHRDADFKNLMKKVGAPRFCKALSIYRERKDVEHIYQCIECNMKYKRKRKVNTQKYRCGICRGSLKKLY
ncbi:SprT family protein [Priestia megaterium]|nr:SprT family protein [Priestia megaterium]